MSADRLPGLIMPIVFVIALVGVPLALRREKRRPSSYTRRPNPLAAWHATPTAEQEAVDTAVLDASEAAERVVDRDALEMELRATANALFRP